MKRIRTDDQGHRIGPAAVRRSLADPLGAEHLAMTYFELAPGDSFAFGYHAHERQEEVFVLLEGSVAFETEVGEVVVDANEAIRFAPGEFQRGVNAGTERVTALAIGAPRDPGELTALRDCAACGDRTPISIERADDERAVVTICDACGAETGRFTQ